VDIWWVIRQAPSGKIITHDKRYVKVLFPLDFHGIPIVD